MRPSRLQSTAKLVSLRNEAWKQKAKRARCATRMTVVLFAFDFAAWMTVAVVDPGVLEDLEHVLLEGKLVGVALDFGGDFFQRDGTLDKLRTEGGFYIAGKTGPSKRESGVGALG